MLVSIDGVDIQMEEVLYVLQLSANLLSVAKIAAAGNKVQFDGIDCRIYNLRGQKLLQARARNGVYMVDSSAIECRLASDDTVGADGMKNDAMDWHRKFGHLNIGDMTRLKSSVDGLEFDGKGEEVRECITCMMGKQPRAPFNSSITKIKSTTILELVHTDLCGPMEVTSSGGARYLLTFTDDFSRKVFVYFLKSKVEVSDTIKAFVKMVERQTDQQVKRIRSDNGTEFVNSTNKIFFKNAGIIHKTSCAYTPQQNGVAERMNRTLVERGRCLLIDAELEKRFWGEAVNMAAYVVNRSVNRSLGGKVPEEIWRGKRINVSDLKIFGTPVMVLIPEIYRKKLDPKSKQLGS